MRVNVCIQTIVNFFKACNSTGCYTKRGMLPEQYSQHFIFFLTLQIGLISYCYITVDWKYLPGTKTILLIGPFRKLHKNEVFRIRLVLQQHKVYLSRLVRDKQPNLFVQNIDDEEKQFYKIDNRKSIKFEIANMSVTIINYLKINLAITISNHDISSMERRFRCTVLQRYFCPLKS